MLNDFVTLAKMKGNVDSKILKLGIVKFMKRSSLWNESLIREIPKSWEKYGDLILFSRPFFENEKWHEAGQSLLEFICQLMKVKRIAIKGAINNDDFRTPRAKILYGDSSSVLYKDNKIIYTWDVEKNMFCPGNVTERHRIAKIDCDGEVIVDLFAGIGYFTLPYLVHSKAKLVHACEWNPYAIEALRRNLKENGVENRCQIHEGDCRQVCPEGVADRVNLGLIPSSECGWGTACKALLASGGVLYVHQNVTSKVSPSGDEAPCDVCLRLYNSLRISELFPIFPLVEVTASRPSTDTFLLEATSATSSPFEACLVEYSRVHWKWLEWFLFSLHVSHVVVSLLEQIHPFRWTVTVTAVNKVKSYAPHVDHLVYTLDCRPEEV